MAGREVAMRYGKDHKQATRQRILEAAGRRFKKDGIDGAGVAAVMSDAGLTNGAFYAHFASKEDLVANVLADQRYIAACGPVRARPVTQPAMRCLRGLGRSALTRATATTPSISPARPSGYRPLR